MATIKFETPTLNTKGEILTWTRHAAEQFTEVLDKAPGLDMLVIPSGVFQMGSPRHLGTRTNNRSTLSRSNPFY